MLMHPQEYFERSCISLLDINLRVAKVCVSWCHVNIDYFKIKLLYHSFKHIWCNLNVEQFDTYSPLTKINQ